MTTIRVTNETHRRIADLAHRTGNPMTEVVSRAVDALERQVYFGEVNRRFEELRSEPESWAEIVEERAVEGTALRDASR